MGVNRANTNVRSTVISLSRAVNPPVTPVLPLCTHKPLQRLEKKQWVKNFTKRRVTVRSFLFLVLSAIIFCGTGVRRSASRLGNGCAWLLLRYCLGREGERAVWSESNLAGLKGAEKDGRECQCQRASGQSKSESAQPRVWWRRQSVTVALDPGECTSFRTCIEYYFGSAVMGVSVTLLLYR